MKPGGNRKGRLAPPAAPALRMWPIEVNRARRGHDFFPDASAPIPPLRSENSPPGADTLIAAHYHLGASDWWIAEADAATGEALAYVRMNGRDSEAHWSYLSLHDMERLLIAGRAVIERDIDWRPMVLADIPNAPWARDVSKAPGHHTRGLTET